MCVRERRRGGARGEIAASTHVQQRIHDDLNQTQDQNQRSGRRERLLSSLYFFWRAWSPNLGLSRAVRAATTPQNCATSSDARITKRPELYLPRRIEFIQSRGKGSQKGS